MSIPNHGNHLSGRGIHDIPNPCHHELLPNIEEESTQFRIAQSKQPKLLLQVLRQLRQVEPTKRQERDTNQRINPEPHLLPQRKLPERSDRRSNREINKNDPGPNRPGSLNCSEHLLSWRRTCHLTSKPHK